jgi:outer membrane protein assembly factor BamA
MAVMLKKNYIDIHKAIFIFVLTFLCTVISRAQDTVSAENLYRDFIVLPFLIYAPETGLAGGLGAYYVSHDTNNREIFPYPDEIEFYVQYTQRNQYSGKVEPTFYFDGGWRLNARLSFLHFPDFYYGIGIDSREVDEVEYTRDNYIARLTLERALYRHAGKDVYGGLTVQAKETSTTISPETLKFFENTAPGFEGNSVYSTGLAVIADFRNNVFSPDSGYFLSSELLYHVAQGSQDFNYLTFFTDMRYFIELYGNTAGQGHILGLQSTLGMSYGEIPFNEMFMIGSDMIMRGYYEGRFRDHNVMAFQAEYRYPLFWRLRGTLFGGAGTVSQDMMGLFGNKYVFAGGIGGRFVWDKESKLSARLDIGFTSEGPGIYLNVKEAF